MRAELGALLALIAIGVSAVADAAARELSETEKARVRAAADRLRSSMHWTPESVDLDAVVEAVAARARTSTGTVDIGRWIQEELNRNWVSWIPTAPVPQYEVQYAYPLDVRVPRLVLSARGQGTIDFLTRVGTPVYAARAGKVARVVDGFTECCLPANAAFKTNQALVEHADGTVASYSRLRSGIDVKEGQEVAVGDLIGHTGFAGATQVPGLLFHVWKWGGKGSAGLPVRFADGSVEGAALETGQSIVERPPRRLKLRLLADGRRILGNQKASVGDVVRLRVLHVRQKENVVDVSRRAGTRFDTSTPWLVDVGHGMVTFRKADWPGAPEGNVATVTALYRDPDTGDVGYVDARFELSE